MWVYEPDSLRARCKGCAAPIRWATTETYAKVPLDEAFIPTGNEYFDEQGLKLIEVKPSYSHFTTCPMRDRFKAAAKKAA